MSPYTKQQITAADHTDLADFLFSHGETVRRKGKRYLWEKHQVWIDGGKWYTHYLCDRQGRYEFCYVSHKHMASDFKISVFTVKRALDELERKGYVTIEQRRRANGSRCCNVYRCHSPSE